VYASLGMLQNFQQMLDNIFSPLFEVTCNPDSDPLLHAFLGQISGLDCQLQARGRRVKARGARRAYRPPPRQKKRFTKPARASGIK
jgi:hypothetical protein